MRHRAGRRHVGDGRRHVLDFGGGLSNRAVRLFGYGAGLFGNRVIDNEHIRRTALTGALLLVAAIMNIVLTSVFASLIAPAAAVLGFLLSSLFLAVASLISIARMSRRADHAYYAAV